MPTRVSKRAKANLAIKPKDAVAAADAEDVAGRKRLAEDPVDGSGVVVAADAGHRRIKG